MSFGSNLVSLRKSKNISRKELAEMLDIPYTTLRNYEADQREPGHKFLIKVANLFSVSVDELIGNALKNDTPSLSNEALQVAIDYSDLDKPGKRAVRVTLDDQRRRVKEEANRNDKVTLFPVKEYIQSASAGYGDFFDDDSFDVVDLVKRPPAGTTYLVKVDGDSMEPTYHDGDRLFVSAQETLNFGEIGVFSINGDLYIKEYGRAGLVSHNPTYPIRRPSPYDSSKIIGRVLGVCTSDYMNR